jgi:hypothetical protein
MATAPKFTKIEILLRKNKINHLLTEGSIIDKVESTELLTFEDCALVLSGNYLVVVKDETPTPIEKILKTETIGEIFNLDDVIKYKTIRESEYIKREIPESEK